MCVCVSERASKRTDELNSAVGLALVPLDSLFWSSRLEGFDDSATSVASKAEGASTCAHPDFLTSQ